MKNSICLNRFTVSKVNKIDNLRVLYCNARSVRNKLDDLKGLLACEVIHIIGITESWTSDEDLATFLNINGFLLFRKDRIGKRGGGVLIYVHEDITCSELILENKLQGIEALWIRLNNSKGNVLTIGNIYRPPSCMQDHDVSLFSAIYEVCQGSGDIVLMGDFNFPAIDWENNVANDGKGSDFLELTQDCFLGQMVHDHTREDALLDLVFCSDVNLVGGLTVGEHLGDSDHRIIRFDIAFHSSKITNYRIIPNFRNVNFHGIRADLAIPFGNGLAADNTMQQWDEFRDKLGTVVNKHISFRRKRDVLNFSPPWFTRDTKKALNFKQRAFKLFKGSGKDSDRITYVIARKEFKYAKRQHKLIFEEKLAKGIKKNPKDFFAYARGGKCSDVNLGPLDDIHGNVVADELGMANILNDFFSDVFNRDFCFDGVQLENQSDDFRDCTFSRESVVKFLSGIRPHKAPGPDNIYPKILVECAEELADVVLTIFKSSYDSGCVPTDWKLANITPLFKNGSKGDPSNYRPVSLTSVICKIFETFIKQHLMSFFDERKLLSDNQFGFRPGKSCTTNLLRFYDKVTESLDKKNDVDVVYIDFQKAFDKVPHEALLIKLRQLGIGGKTLLWIENWLTDRRQRVQIKGIYSNWSKVGSGVPQGSVLGPILFIAFIDDISSGICNPISIFADDLKIMGVVNTEEEGRQLQRDLDNLSAWASKWGMFFNIGKCQVLHMGGNNMNFNYFLNGFNIQHCDSVKDLGIMVCKDFKFGYQCSVASKKANKLLGYIKRSISSRSRDIVLPLYKGLVRPHLEYAVQFWSPYLRKDIDMIERVQHRATKMIRGFWNLSYPDRLNELHMYTLEQRRIRGDLIQLFKFIKSSDTEGLVFFSDQRTRGHAFKLRRPVFNRDFRKNYFFVRVMDIWNGLPENVVSSPSVDVFKRNLDCFWGSVGGL